MKKVQAEGGDKLLEVIWQLTTTNQKQQEEITILREELQHLNTQIAWFTRQMFGRKSEKLSALDPNQLTLDFDGSAPSILHETSAIETARESAENEIAQMAVMEKKKPVRRQRKLLEGLPVVEVVVEPDRVDLEKYIRIEEEHTRTSEFEPGRLYVKDIIRPKYGLRSSVALPPEEGKGVLIAPLPLLPIYKGLAGPTLLAEILLAKYVYHLPFYR